MKKIKVFQYYLGVFLALCFILAACSEMSETFGAPTKAGEIKLTNASRYTDDDPVTAQLFSGNDLKGEKTLYKNDSITWTNLSPETYYSIKVTDKNGTSKSSGSIYLSINASRVFKYNGEYINEE
jgi:hypothetical protein